MPTIAALVLSLPERHHLLCEALKAIGGQTRPPDDVVVGIDPRRLGEAANMTRLQDATDCDFFAFLHDDDLWYPEHLAVAEKYFDTADVIVSRFDLVGRPVSSMEPWHDSFDDLRWTNWISSPTCVLARASICDRWVGPYDKYRWVDWAQLNYLLDKGARFVDTKQTTVTCRFGDWGNGSWKG